MYKVEIEVREDDYLPNAKLATLQECVEHVQHQCSGYSHARVWINNKSLTYIDGRLLTDDNQELCTNPEWHRLFASEKERILPREETVDAAMVRLGRIRHARPTNPATLVATGRIEP